MLKHHANLTTIRTAIDNLVAHPPETPMEQLRAALLVAEANGLLADADEHAKRLQRRTTLPDGYRVLHRKPKRGQDPDDEVWSVLHTPGSGAGGHTGVETQIGTSRYREKGHELAWAHHEEPEIFET